MFTPVHKSFLVIALRAMSIAAVVGGIAGLIGGAHVGISLVAVVVLLAFLYYAWKLAQLFHWLENPQAATLPDADGIWGDVLGRLYRLIKQERVSRKSLPDALSRFQQAATALPDGALMLDDQNNIVWLNPVGEQHWGISLASDRNRLETMRRDFVANVSHELRTPITFMAGFPETVCTAGVGNPELLEKSLAHMTTQAQRMQRLVGDLLTLSRLEDNRHRPPQAPINAPELIASLVVDAGQLSAGRHRIATNIAPQWLLGNRDEIASAFGNLISNAVRYTPAGGKIDISWAIEGNAPVFRVRDNGEGIAAEHVPRLTERFYRVDRGRSQATGGTGLGLAIVKHVLIRHGAHLDVRSSQDAALHGAQFSILFPADRVCDPLPKPQAIAA